MNRISVVLAATAVAFSAAAFSQAQTPRSQTQTQHQPPSSQEESTQPTPVNPGDPKAPSTANKPSASYPHRSGHDADPDDQSKKKATGKKPNTSTKPAPNAPDGA